MATPRKKYKIRDKDATMRALKEVVGDILRESGFWELRTTAIARRLGKDKNIIRYHFGGLGQLLSAYVREKDYWPPFFDRFRPTEQVSTKEMEAVFIELMKENFRHFVTDSEMQKVILWQASTSHPVMRSASTMRENAGRELIRLTDRWFVGTDVHFGAVLAIILGGTYFPILQCAAGNGECCGLDTGIARDREVLQRTIGQIIHWAWHAAGERKIGTEMKELDYEYELLENLIAERIKTGKTTGGSDYRVISEAKRLESLLLDELVRLDNEIQIRLFLKTHLNRLVGLCNRVYDPKVAVNPDAELLLEIMDELRKAASDMLPGEVTLPRLFRDRMVREYSGRWTKVSRSLQDMGIDPALLDSMEIPLDSFSNSRQEASWKAFQYLRKYITGLEAVVNDGVLNGWLVCERLIGLGFNHVRFATYLTHSIRAKRVELDEREQREFLQQKRQQVLQIHRLNMMRFDTDMPPIAEELTRWLDAEIEGVTGTVKKGSASMKLNTTFKATQLALWQKLLYDHGVYEEANLDLLSEKTAYAFTTKGQESLSPASIKSKFYTKDTGAIKAIRKLIADMRDDLEDFE